MRRGTNKQDWFARSLGFFEPAAQGGKPLDRDVEVILRGCKGAVAGLPPLSTVCANAGLAASRAIAETQRRCRHSKMVKRIPCEVSAVQLARGGVAAICRPAADLRGIRTDFAAPTLVANFDRVAAKAEDPNPPVRVGNGQMFAAPMMRGFFIGPYSCGIA